MLKADAVVVRRNLTGKKPTGRHKKVLFQLQKANFRRVPCFNGSDDLRDVGPRPRNSGCDRVVGKVVSVVFAM